MKFGLFVAPTNFKIFLFKCYQIDFLYLTVVEPNHTYLLISSIVATTDSRKKISCFSGFSSTTYMLSKIFLVALRSARVMSPSASNSIKIQQSSNLMIIKVCNDLRIAYSIIALTIAFCEN